MVGDAPSTARLLLRAALWLILALVGSFLGGFAAGFGAGLLESLHHGPSAASKMLLAGIAPASGLALQGVLLLGAWPGRPPPHGAGLDAAPIRRPVLLAALTLGQLVATSIWTVIVVQQFGIPSTTVAAVVRHSAQSAPWLIGVLVVLTVLVAPVCEELFFRGWLWTALRRRWGPVPTALVTAVPWLLMHLPDGGWRRSLVLLPAAILFSVARQACGSVRASIVMHVSNNAVVALVGMAAFHKL